MRRDTTIDPDELNRPAGNSLQENYTLHDKGEQHIMILLTAQGYRVERWGLQARDDDGDGVLFDDKMDLKVFDGDELVGIIEVKTKSKKRHLGMMNERHFDDYQQIATERSVPVAVVFLSPDGRVGYHAEWTLLGDDCEPLRAFQWPDGNGGVEVEATHTTREILSLLNQQT